MLGARVQKDTCLRAVIRPNLSFLREAFEYVPSIFKVEYDSIREVMFSPKTTTGRRLVEPTPPLPARRAYRPEGREEP